MTTPGGNFPDDAISSDDLTPLQGLDEASWRANISGQAVGGFNAGHVNLLGVLGDTITQGLIDVAEALFGPFSEDETTAVQHIQDGQLALNNRLDLMGDISGYAVAYIPINYYRNANYFFNVPFYSRVGPQKNATVNGDGTITLAKGTWRIFALMTSDQHNNLISIMRIEVLRPNGSIYSYKESQQNVNANKWNTYQIYHPVVLPDAGYKVRVRFRYNRGPGLNLYFRGGTHLSHLAVDRMDLNSDNAVVDENVPDE